MNNKKLFVALLALLSIIGLRGIDAHAEEKADQIERQIISESVDAEDQILFAKKIDVQSKENNEVNVEAKYDTGDLHKKDLPIEEETYKILYIDKDEDGVFPTVLDGDVKTEYMTIVSAKGKGKKASKNKKLGDVTVYAYFNWTDNAGPSNKITKVGGNRSHDYGNAWYAYGRCGQRAEIMGNKTTWKGGSFVKNVSCKGLQFQLQLSVPTAKGRMEMSVYNSPLQ